MLLTQQLLQILEAIDSAVKVYLIDEIVGDFELMDLLLYL